MATPAQLVRAVSDLTGVALPTIVDIDRKLVKGDLRAKSGRGFSVARMTPLDAARLLTAVLASPQANSSVEAVQRYAQTQVDRSRSSEELFGTIEVADLGTLRATHSFVEGLAALIHSAAAGDLADLAGSLSKKGAPQIEVFAFTRATHGRIRIAGLPNGLTASVEYRPASGGARKRPRVNPTLPRLASAVSAEGDLEQSRRITGRTIWPIAQLLAEEMRHD